MNADFTYGTQEAPDNFCLRPGCTLITEDSEWYGVTLAGFYNIRPGLKIGLRSEWFRDDDGANSWWKGAPPEIEPFTGDFYAITANLSWIPKSFIRIRPEIRYDWYNGSGKPYGRTSSKISPVDGRVVDGSLLPGTEDSQFVGGIDITIFF